MECAWTDYIGSTEDCWELTECYDGLYEQYINYYQFLTVNTEDPFYTVEEFTIPSGTPTFTFILDRNLLLEDPELGEIGITLRVGPGLGEEGWEDSTGYTIESVTQESETEYVHVISFTLSQSDTFIWIYVTRNSAEIELLFSGVKVPNGELRTFCTPISIVYSPS